MTDFNESGRQSNDSMYDLRLVSRNENTKVNALKEHYDENDGGESTNLKYAIRFGQWVFPAFVLVFYTAYWITGMQKYYIGK